MPLNNVIFKGQILIHNCDTYHNAKDINYSLLLNDGSFGIIPCFEAKGDHWSFVEIDKDSNKAIRVTEKKLGFLQIAL